MIKVRLEINQLTSEQLREVAASCSKNREYFSVGYDWQPRVSCEGPNFFAVKIDPVPAIVATEILACVRP